MKAIKPSVLIDGDSNDRIMSRSGEMVGFTKSRVVWRYGFLSESDNARVYHVHTDSFYWVIAKYNGDVLETFQGYAFQLPARFNNIIDGKL